MLINFLFGIFVSIIFFKEKKNKKKGVENGTLYNIRKQKKKTKMYLEKFLSKGGGEGEGGLLKPPTTDPSTHRPLTTYRLTH